MPAPTKQRKGALRAARTKKSTQTARSKAAEASAQTEDPDFVDETGAETEFEGDDQVEKDEGVGGGSKRKPLTDAQHRGEEIKARHFRTSSTATIEARLKIANLSAQCYFMVPRKLEDTELTTSADQDNM
ncbi:hypothetical protein R3P38DRAFT_2806400 [Favolaschia claudopus]|uniref:Uncharacterized protein n=1 Tax=Favolaschia claudopus TaxID=2862362 RepID=A0AAV9ZK55_9AGAR